MLGSKNLVTILPYECDMFFGKLNYPLSLKSTLWNSSSQYPLCEKAVLDQSKTILESQTCCNDNAEQDCDGMDDECYFSSP